MPRTPKPKATPSAAYLANMEGVAAVDRALHILMALEEAGGPLALADLARATGMYKSTLLRLLVSLEKAHLVGRGLDQRYMFGPLAFRLGRAYEATFHLKACLVPVMQALVEAGTESPSFHVIHDERTRLCVLRIDSRHSTLDRVDVGDIFPLDRGAAGTVLTAFRNHIPTSKSISIVRVSYGERDPSCAAVACPVFRAGNELAGALSLSGPLERFTAPAVETMKSLLLEAAKKASRALGGEW